jgi:F0F1-type ATP synthase assembly protein I
MASGGKQPKDSPAGMWRTAGEYGAVGLEMGLAVVVGYYAGTWLDEQLGTEPYLFWFMLAAGFGAAFKGLFRVFRKGLRELSDDTPEDR